MARLTKALVIGIALFVLGGKVGSSTHFTDVAPQAWYAADVERLAELGAVSGYPSPSGGVKFSPERPMTRAEFLKICLHALSRGPNQIASPVFPRPYQAPFPDVPVSAWYSGYVAFAKQWRITEAARVLFDPDATVTRREAVGFVIRTLDLNGGARAVDPLRVFPDSSDPEVINARSARIVTGGQDGLFHPNRSLNRAEAAVLVARALRNLETAPLVRFEMTAFSLDNPPLIESSIVCPCTSLGIRLNSPGESRNLIRVRLHGDPPPGEGTYYALHRSNNHIKVWPHADRSLPAYLADTDTYRFEFGVAEDVFVENVTFGESILSFELRRKSDNGVIARQTVGFKTLETFVIVLGGWTQDPENYNPEDPYACSENKCGIFDIGERLYQTGYDAWLFNEAQVDAFGHGRVYDLVRQAIEDRGVRKIAIIGYSRGGGGVYALASALANDADEILGEFEVVYTAYVDAITNWSNSFEMGRPPRSQFHLNFFQLKSCRTNPVGLCGIPSLSVDGLVTINVPVNDLDWGVELEHSSIDDHPQVSLVIINTMKELVQP